MYRRLQRSSPLPVRRYILHFEAAIEDAVSDFSQSLPQGKRVLDAGAGEGSYRHFFSNHRYVGLDLGIGDSAWDYSSLDVIADLQQIPFTSGCFAGALSIVTLEHVREPAYVLGEIARVLEPDGRLLLVVPHEWEEHQQPHDYFRYTRYGLRYLLERSGFFVESIEPVGGYFRLLSRRLLNGLQFFPRPLVPLAAIALGPPALAAPLLDGLDKQRNFTLGYICLSRRRV